MYVSIQELCDKILFASGDAIYYDPVTGEYFYRAAAEGAQTPAPVLPLSDEVPDTMIAIPRYNSGEILREFAAASLVVRTYRKDPAIKRWLHCLEQGDLFRFSHDLYWGDLGYGLQQEYEAFVAEHLGKIAVAWCEEHGLPYSRK